MASGDGVIIKAGWCGGGGNCVKIKHNKTYQTIYAHMKNFSNISIPGNRVTRTNYWVCWVNRNVNRSSFTLRSY